MKVPIENLYYLFCFAWRFIPDDLAIDVGTEQGADVLNMCAHVLVGGVDHLLRRGLDQGYVSQWEDTPRLRGRILVTETISRLQLESARVTCEFDELTPNVLHNQILKTTVRVLLDAPDLKNDIRERLAKTDVRLGGIGCLHLSDALFRRVQLHRNNSFYAFLMRICQLVHASLLPTKSGEQPYWFRDVLGDEEYMSAVFEEFIYNFFDLKRHRHEFTVGRPHLDWNATAVNPEHLKFLPTMRTDVVLRSGARMIVMDAKYYRDALQAYYGTGKIHSEHLYQILAYLRAATKRLQSPHVVEGILIYPVSGAPLNLPFEIDGYPVSIVTLNLGQSWRGIEADLLRLLEGLPALAT